MGLISLDSTDLEAEQARGEAELWLPVLEAALLNSARLVELAEGVPRATAAVGSGAQEQPGATSATAGAEGQEALAADDRLGSILDVARECIEGAAALVLAGLPGVEEDQVSACSRPLPQLK